MSEDDSKRKDREFQYDLTKLQADFGFAISVLIGILAILFGLWVVFFGSTIMTYLIDAEIIMSVVGLLVVMWAKEKWFKSIKRKYELFPKKLSIEISTQDVGLGFYLFDAKDRLESGKTQKTISKEVKIRYEGEQIALAEAAPTIVQITAYIIEYIALPIAVGVLSNYLYDKLKERKDNKLKINGTQVEINAEKIEQLIIIILNQEKETKKEGKT